MIVQILREQYIINIIHWIREVILECFFPICTIWIIIISCLIFSPGIEITIFLIVLTFHIRTKYEIFIIIFHIIVNRRRTILSHIIILIYFIIFTTTILFVFFFIYLRLKYGRGFIIFCQEFESLRKLLVWFILIMIFFTGHSTCYTFIAKFTIRIIIHWIRIIIIFLENITQRTIGIKTWIVVFVIYFHCIGIVIIFN